MNVQLAFVAVEASGAEMVTVAVRRIDFDEPTYARRCASAFPGAWKM